MQKYQFQRWKRDGILDNYNKHTRYWYDWNFSTNWKMKLQILKRKPTNYMIFQNQWKLPSQQIYFISIKYPVYILYIFSSSICPSDDRTFAFIQEKFLQERLHRISSPVSIWMVSVGQKTASSLFCMDSSTISAFKKYEKTKLKVRWNMAQMFQILPSEYPPYLKQKKNQHESKC